jgi:hypothetical protein
VTTNQARDILLESFNDGMAIRVVKNAFAEEDKRRSTDSDYVKCPRCYGHHTVKVNFDGLCDYCCSTILTYFPEHESAALIKQSLARYA